jgi:hypothetical protein
LAHELKALSQHAAWLTKQPVAPNEPPYVSKPEQARRLQGYEGRKQLEQELNESLVQLKQMAMRHLAQHPGSSQLKEVLDWAVSKQEMLLSPKVVGKENNRLEVMRASLVDDRRMFGELLEARRFNLSDEDKSVISNLQAKFKPINTFLGAHREPDQQERMWLDAMGHGVSTALPLSPADVKALESDIQSLASQAVGALLAHARSGLENTTQTQSAVAILTQFAGQALSETDEPRARVRLRNLVDKLEPGIKALDTQVGQAADRGDVTTAQLLVRLREQMATAHAAVYAPHLGPTLVPVSAELRQEVDRAEVVAARKLSAANAAVAAGVTSASPASAEISATASTPAQTRVAGNAPATPVGAGGASAELPSNTIEATKELTSALNDADALFRKFGHGKLRKVYGETIQAALRLLTENTHQAPAADRLAMARGLFDPLMPRMQADLGPKGVDKSEKAVILPMLQALERSRL